MRELTMKVQDLEGMMYVGWEGPVNWAYADKCLVQKKEYGVACQKAAGTKVGHIKNHLLMGLYVAYLEDKSVPEQQKQELEDILGPLYRDSAGKISSANAQKAHKVIGHVTVAQGKQASYLTLGFKGELGMRVYGLIKIGLQILGKEQEDPPIGTPVMKDLKKAERQARVALKGAGKGGKK